jgi:hypothetical protein
MHNTIGKSQHALMNVIARTEDQRVMMNVIAKTFDETFNDAGPIRTDVLTALKELIARWEGRYSETEITQ